MIALPASVGLVGPVSSGGSGDPYFSNVVSLLHFDGTNGSTTFTDVIGKTWSAVGSAQLSTATKKYGTAALNLSAASGDAISTPGHADFNFGTGDFTIEGWFCPAATTRGYWYSCDDNVAALIVTPSSGDIEIYGPGSYVINPFSTGAMTPGTFYFLSLSRQGNAWYFHRDGILQATQPSDSRSWGNSTGTVRIGRYSGGIPLGGYHDDIRTTKGVGRYGSGNYTPPTAAFPDS